MPIEPFPALLYLKGDRPSNHSPKRKIRSLSASIMPAMLSQLYDRGMSIAVNLEAVRPRKLAAVRREVAPSAIGSEWRPALDKVWEFLRG
jgi:hypothetical protein